MKIYTSTKLKSLLLLIFLHVCPVEIYAQGQFPIIANIGYAAATDEVRTHFAVPGATPGSPGDPYSNQVASGSYSIYPAFNNPTGTIRRPIIIAEGFDPTDIYDTDEIIELLNGNENLTGDDLANQLRTQGYDLIVLDYDDGGQLIQRNAFILVRLIQLVNSIKTTTCPIILAGYSMGGIVARYALNYMESQSLAHNVGLYFSFDSPQKGANIPLGMQDLINWMDNHIATYGLSAEIRAQSRSIHSYAAQQMLIYHTDDNFFVGETPQVNRYFTRFYNQMKGLVGGNGYPNNCKKIAASLGNWTGLGQAYMNPANQWVDHTGGVLAENPLAFSFSGARDAPFIGYGIAGAGAPLPYNIASTIAWGTMYISVNSAVFTSSHTTGYKNADIPADVMPGSFTPIFRDIATTLNGFGANSNLRMNNACFIPTVSALDFDTNNWYHAIGNDPNRLSKTPFASIFATVNNRDHNFPITNNIALTNWILNEIAVYNATVTCTTPPLPVNLVHFTVTKSTEYAEAETALLDWQTSSEFNSDHFDIERSQNGKEWISIGKIKSMGNNNSKSHYSFTDKTPLEGENLYRLKMVDKDGTFAYSRIRGLYFDALITFYPNPVNSRLKIKGSISRKIQLINNIGSIIYSSDTIPAEGIDMSDMPSTTYLVKILNNDGSYTIKKVVKQ